MVSILGLDAAMQRQGVQPKHRKKELTALPGYLSDSEEVVEVIGGGVVQNVGGPNQAWIVVTDRQVLALCPAMIGNRVNVHGAAMSEILDLKLGEISGFIPTVTIQHRRGEILISFHDKQVYLRDLLVHTITEQRQRLA